MPGEWRVTGALILKGNYLNMKAKKKKPPVKKPTSRNPQASQ
jgi:hypothetical protein